MIRPRCAGRFLVGSLLAFAAGCSNDGESVAPLPLLTFGRTGVGPLEFNYPRAAALSPDGRLYVVDKAGRIQAFTQDGEFVLDWHMPAIDAGKPTGLGIDSQGRVYAADTHYARIVIFSSDGQLERMVGTYGDGPGQFRLPTDVAFAADGTIYVSEYGGNDRISKYTPDWEFVTSFGGPDSGEARLERPQSIAFDRDGAVWIADSCNHRICKFSPEGELLKTFGTLGSAPGELRFPYSIEFLSDGTLLVCEYGNNRVQRFSADGQSLGTWGKAGRDVGQLAYPWALVVADHDRVFIVDSGNNRVQAIDGTNRANWHTP